MSRELERLVKIARCEGAYVHAPCSLAECRRPRTSGLVVRKAWLYAGVYIHRRVLHISSMPYLTQTWTDYVFDGTSLPYSPKSPMQLYGQTKRDGELAIQCVEGAKSVILRVPVLYASLMLIRAIPQCPIARYGPAPRDSDFSNILLDVVSDQSENLQDGSLCNQISHQHYRHYKLPRALVRYISRP